MRVLLLGALRQVLDGALLYGNGSWADADGPSSSFEFLRLRSAGVARRSRGRRKLKRRFLFQKKKKSSLFTTKTITGSKKMEWETSFGATKEKDVLLVFLLLSFSHVNCFLVFCVLCSSANVWIVRCSFYSSLLFFNLNVPQIQINENRKVWRQDSPYRSIFCDQICNWFPGKSGEAVSRSTKPLSQPQRQDSLINPEMWRDLHGMGDGGAEWGSVSAVLSVRRVSVTAALNSLQGNERPETN